MFINFVLGAAIFSLLGQHALVLGLIVLLFIPLTVVLNAQEGVITSCVILLHVFNAKAINGHLIINEILLLTVGLGIAFIMNLMMPSLDKKLKRYKTISNIKSQMYLRYLVTLVLYVKIN